MLLCRYENNTEKRDFEAPLYSGDSRDLFFIVQLVMMGNACSIKIVFGFLS